MRSNRHLYSPWSLEQIDPSYSKTEAREQSAPEPTWTRGTELTCRGDRSHHSLRSSLLLVDLVDGGAGPGQGGQQAEQEDDDLHGV